MTTLNKQQVCITISSDVLEEITKRKAGFIGRRSPGNASHVIDRDMKRFYGVLKRYNTEILKSFTKNQLNELYEILSPYSSTLRTLPITWIESLFEQLVLPKSLGAKIAKLDLISLVALLDVVENLLPQKKQKKKKKK